jgi:hypothetical protein
MTPTRVVLIGVALLAGATATARAQQRPPRWGGSPPATNQTHPHVTYQGPVVIVEPAPFTVPGAASRSPAAGGSWDGRRPVSGGSPPVQRRQGTTDLSGFFGYVPPRGETAQSARIQPARRATWQDGVSIPARDTVQHHPRITWP